ncbi:MAG: RNA polymerase sigma-54 factor, partial [Verrucomicrobia bacterium]|nr:RNA polymerase sigma-54 factor [Verrucomicrobiota bacterium]
MAQGLHLSQRMSLSQVLAPQLQQSLALLQAPTLELKALVEQELEQNPMLEEVPVTEPTQEEKAAGERDESTTQADPAEPPTDVTFDPATEKASSEPVDDFQAEFERLTQMDQEWRDHFSQTNVPMRQSEEEEERRQFMFDSLVAGSSLQENLLEQVRLSDMPEDLRRVAEMIIGNIDERGFLQATLDELAFSTNIPAEQIQTALKEIQQFDPPGVGARDVRECLLLQLARQGKQDSLEYKVVEQHMEALGRRRLPEIARGLGVEVDEIQDAAENIGNLEPNPGRAFLPDDQQYVVPEVFVEKVGDDYVVTNNNTEIPHLRISNAYKDLMSQPNATQEVREYIREKIRAGKFLIKSIHQRQQTILNIANEIV